MSSFRVVFKEERNSAIVTIKFCHGDLIANFTYDFGLGND